jgi:methionyl-tRNA formyltransferase
MKLIIAGKNNIAVDVLKHVLDTTNISVSVVLNKTDNYKNSFQKSLGYFATQWSVPILKLENVCDLENVIFLSLEFDQIIKPHLFKEAKFFNIHFSLLPKYKGMYTSAIPILNGEKYSGVTLHKIDAGIDTGDIIAQNTFAIDKEDTARDLYLKYIKHGTNLVIDNIHNLIKGEINATKQEINESSYYGRNSLDYRNLKINYNQTAFQISNELRAFNFREYQLPKFQEYDISGWTFTRNKSNLKAGSIINKDEYTIEISTIDYNIILKIDQFKPLISACKANDWVQVQDILMNTDFNLETKTIEGWTPLMISAYYGSFEVVKLLIQSGSNVNAINYNGTSVLMYAKQNLLKTKDLRIVNFLFKKGVNANLRDNYGKNIFDWLKLENEEYYQYFKKNI